MKTRRDFIKTCSAIVAGTAVAQFDAFGSSSAQQDPLTGIDFPIRDLEARIDKPITYVVVGAGSRGNAYAAYAEKFPGKAQLIGVSDINDFRREKMSNRFKVAPDRRYGDYREILGVPKFADAMVISLPDYLHYDAAMKAMELGYHILLEKPMAQTEKECRSLLAQSKRHNRIVALGHVLRYAPYFIALRETVRSGIIGDLVSIQHMEPIEHIHFSHSYVRGNWHNSKETTPIILSKSCHDLDILRWIVDKPCISASADGDLRYFKEANAPEGAPLRCTDGCPYDSECPFSTNKVYANGGGWSFVLDLSSNPTREEIDNKLKLCNYGKCVFHCDNDQPDHYISNFVFEGGTTATFSMEAFTPWGGRRTRIMGTKGYIEGTEGEFTVTDFLTKRPKVWNMDILNKLNISTSGHGGGDLALFRDFAEAVFYEDVSRLTSNIEASVESHIMGFMCEKSRKSNKKYAVRL